jgi:hypothetical protein
MREKANHYPNLVLGSCLQVFLSKTNRYNNNRQILYKDNIRHNKYKIFLYYNRIFWEVYFIWIKYIHHYGLFDILLVSEKPTDSKISIRLCFKSYCF